jgi:GTP-binding protein HflX
MPSRQPVFSPDGRGTKIASRLSKQKDPATLSSRGTSSKNHLYETERSDGIASEKAVLVRVTLPGQVVGDDPLDEITGLAETAGARVVSGMIQRRETPDVTAYLGKGKIEELKNAVAHHDADVVIFDNDLAPSQTRNLERAVGVKVLDRTELILDIFASNAKTYEARLAVELAQLEYSLPRLKRMWTHLSRIKAGIGMRGPGEKQIEEDRRLVENRIHELRSELKDIEKRKERLVASRSDRLTVSLVGYTNAGKSTLMNSLTGAGVLTANKLFATLDTRTRRWMLPSWGPVLLSDTVGFIRDLPHGLIASFKATLEEARQADLLLHIADAANPAVLEQITAVYEVLRELGIQEKDTLLILNKVDRLADRGALTPVLHRYPNAIPISARTREGFERLHHAASDALSRSFADLDVETSVSNGRMLAYLAAHGEIIDRHSEGDRVLVHVRLPQRHLGALHEKGTSFRTHQPILSAAREPIDSPTAVEDVA